MHARESVYMYIKFLEIELVLLILETERLLSFVFL